MLSRKEFKKFYDTEVEFSSLSGVNASKAHKQELSDMFSIYKATTNNKDFTTKMLEAGYGLI